MPKKKSDVGTTKSGIEIGASLIDLLLFYVIFGVISAVIIGISEAGERNSLMFVTNIISIFILIGIWLYFALMESSVSQATLGEKYIIHYFRHRFLNYGLYSEKTSTA